MENEDIVSLWQKTIQSEYRRFLTDMAVVARSMNIPLYLVGGFLRDMIIGNLSKETIDLDIVVEGDGLAFAEELQKKYGGRLRIHQRFGTANWFIHEQKSQWVSSTNAFPNVLDIISARREVYKHPGELPIVLRGCIEDDLDRRDFSINTLAIRLDTSDPVLIDRHNALNDIKAGAIRVLHDKSFMDDPSRIFRAVRYEQRYHFHLEEKTTQQLLASIEYIKNLSADRIRNEINHILEEENVIEMLERLDELGILGVIQPGLYFNTLQRKRVYRVIQEINAEKIHQPILTHEYRQKMVYAAWLSSFDPVFSKTCAESLNLSANLKSILIDFFTIKERGDILKTPQRIEVAEFLDTISLLSIRLAKILEEEPPRQAIFQEYLQHWRHTYSAITGDDLKKKDIPAGPAYSIILRRLRAARLNGIIHTRQEEKDYLDKILAEMKKDDA